MGKDRRVIYIDTMKMKLAIKKKKEVGNLNKKW